ncbi:MAG: bifunctional (p)ppGpp synthetase/guanosine-3',5'-bis(diphosphate) 3'-pyrophosphohydrolase [Eggerthellaceae bacterium]|nr:bifunctional (p)ppGpp synthetase/guanosine-3',5'-bis(diphosphate) 3'-pyrophosphohydrolase [Eggerthellaceae bacterium]
MIYTPLTKKAMRLCFEAHEGQVDKTDLPYVNHPLHVAESMDDEPSTCAALLHDVIEDTDYRADDLRAMGFPDEVVDALELLTHEDGVPYLEYVRAIKGNAIARAVKVADLKHNSDLTRLDEVTPADHERVEKYARALEILGAE